MDYHLLELGPASSLVRSVLIASWGAEVRVECVYDPLGEKKGYHLLYKDCSRVVMDPFAGADCREEAADLLGISLGQSEGRKPAILTTDLFEMQVTYGQFQCVKNW